MMPIVYATLSALILFAVSLCLHMRGKCSIWWVITAPAVGMFVFGLLVLSLLFLSGDM